MTTFAGGVGGVFGRALADSVLLALGRIGAVGLWPFLRCVKGDSPGVGEGGVSLVFIGSGVSDGLS